MALPVQLCRAMARRLRVQSSWMALGAAFLLLLFVLVAGACLVHDADADHHHATPSGHVTPPGLCLGVLVVSSVIVLAARPLAAGLAPVLALVPVPTVTVHIPDPPPKSRSLV
jgi:hypothetical protein